MTHGGQRAIDDIARGVVTTHRINRDPDHQRFRRFQGSRGSGFTRFLLNLVNPVTWDRDALFLVDRSGLASFVVSAVAAHAVWSFGFVTMRALPRPVAFSASCVRRFAVRVFE